jgi:hypothetical protein
MDANGPADSTASCHKAGAMRMAPAFFREKPLFGGDFAASFVSFARSAKHSNFLAGAVFPS